MLEHCVLDLHAGITRISKIPTWQNTLTGFRDQIWLEIKLFEISTYLNTNLNPNTPSFLLQENWSTFRKNM